MKTTKEQRAEFRTIPVDYLDDDTIAELCDDADEAERLESEVAKLKERLEVTESGPDGIECRDTTIRLLGGEVNRLRKRLEAFETCVRKLYEDALG